LNSRKTIYFVAGEASADNHGAALMRALRILDADLHFIGRGGPQMKAIAGDQFENWIDKSGVLGLWEVIKHYAYFRKQFRAALSAIEENKPDAVVLIDYPGFNLRLARALRQDRIPRRLIYYISPQVWAWNRGRIKRMAQWIDLMLCIFPFEAELYNQSGLRTVFVGHPMIERLRARKSASLPVGRIRPVADRTDSSRGEVGIERDPSLIGLFPGSRSREVRKIFPILVETAYQLVRRKPGLRFEVAAASPQLARQMEEIVAQSEAKRATPHLRPLPSIMGEAEAKQSRATVGLGAPLPSGRGEGWVGGAVQFQDRQMLEIKVGETADIMQRAFVGIIASGSATLEAAYFRLPFVLIYKISWLTYLAGRLLVRVKYLGMPNVLANREVVPEFIQHAAQPGQLARSVSRLMDEPTAREKMISEFDVIISSLGEAGASEKAAKAILEEVA
jgi:lipid-A-disaccharide synthase